MFITIEGVDGSGKSTLVRGLAAWLEQNKYKYITTREPGGTPTAEALRNIVLSTPMQKLSELYVMSAARIEHCHDVIIPALKDGTWIICDRFAASTYVYQQCERGVPDSICDTVYDSIVQLFADEGLMVSPALTHIELVLDCAYETAISRLSKRNSSLMNLKDTIVQEVFERRRNWYFEYAAFAPTSVIIDANGSEATTLAQAVAQIKDAITQFEARLSSDFSLIG
jgi:dTMP kinase